MRTFTVILDYCGGEKTDRLYEKLTSWNPHRSIFILDNASPANRSIYVTHHNSENRYIGGGITRCIELSEENGCDTLFFITNDIEPATPVVIDQFEDVMTNSDIIQLGAGITPDSTPQGRLYPWMIAHTGNGFRTVPHSDLLCSMIRISFVRDFGYFPPSRGGWGYDFELAYQSFLKHKSIAIADFCIVRHCDNAAAFTDAHVVRRQRQLEMIHTYKARYPKCEFDIQNILYQMWVTGELQVVRHSGSLMI